MKKIVLALVFACLVATVPVQAQTVTATATATWVQLNPLPDAQTFKYVLQDAQPTPPTQTPLTATCLVVTGVTQCSSPAPLPTPGPHKFTVIASSPDGALSAASPVLLGVMPGAPNGFKLTVTVTFAPGS